MLKSEPSQSCFACHQRGAFEKKVVHAPLQKQGCAACHSAHASDQAALLTDKPTQLCLKCHSAKDQAFQKAHGALPVQTG
jgi:predicted CXXCH cytochrome family protein